MKGIIKIWIMCYTMVMGFFTTFAIVWSLLGHDLNSVSLGVITVLSLAAEALFIGCIVERK